jgi:hypothetical protein
VSEWPRIGWRNACVCVTVTLFCATNLIVRRQYNRTNKILHPAEIQSICDMQTRVYAARVTAARLLGEGSNNQKTACMRATVLRVSQLGVSPQFPVSLRVRAGERKEDTK